MKDCQDNVYSLPRGDVGGGGGGAGGAHPPPETKSFFAFAF